MNQSVPNGSTKAEEIVPSVTATPSSIAMPGALKANWMVSHST